MIESTGTPQSKSTSAPERLRQCREKILKIWEERARARLPEARAQSKLVLRDELPGFLDRLAEALSRHTYPREVKEGKVAGREHGWQRGEYTGYTTVDILVEYDILRRAIFEVLEEGMALDFRERAIILDFIGTAMIEAGSAFAKYQDGEDRKARRKAAADQKLLRAQTLRKTRYVGIVLPILIFFALVLLLVWQVAHLISVERWVGHTDQVLAQTRYVEKLAVDLEAGVRGFVVTGKSDFLAPYQNAESKLPANIESLRALLRDNPSQTERIAKLQEEVTGWLAFGQSAIQLKRTGGEASSLVQSGEGKRRMDSIRATIHEILGMETHLRAERVAATTRASRVALLLTILGFFVIGITLGRNLYLRWKWELVLLESEERFRVLVEGVKDYAIYLLDPEGFVESWNPGAEKLKGYSAKEIVGQHFSVFFAPDAVGRRLPEHELEIAKTKGWFEEEGWRVKKDGTQFWASSVITRLLDESGKLIGFAKITRDLTERKRAQDALQRSHDELEHRVKERTADLEKAVKIREDVVSMVSHDLKIPLSSITLNLQLLQRSMKKMDSLGQFRSKIERAESAAKRMNQLISDILDLTKIQAGTLIVELRPEHAADLIGESKEMFEPLAAEKGVQLRMDLESGNCRVLCDHQRILQVLSNLIGNSLKFTPPGGSIRIGCRSESGEVLLSISDTGPGISKEDQKRVFQRYWQAHETAKKGVGLGLAIAKGIIEAHKGRIWVESEPGNGATFQFTLKESNGSPL